MSDWDTVASFETTAGVTYELEQRYDYSKDKYEVRWCHRAEDVNYVQNQWYSDEKVES